MYTSDRILVAQIAEALLYRKWRFGTAESCTGGGVAVTCTSLPGSSRWFEGGLVTYSNEMKQNLLHVSDAILTQHGAVSEPCAAAMARGAQHAMACDVTLSVTGIAGPDGGTPDKPVGTVCFGWALAEHVWTETKLFRGNREEIRTQAATHALVKLAGLIQKDTRN
ncbi:damage-inducible protein CinA [Aliidiomarina taiwanensis]|uniref:Damage-inducible protein CinA n=1 Tax=Aliidiomarina taiwanensis TaxID=946228 RepID=A0A432X9X2_9GAMM|nr:CinA family protein [Aliidiomarina taiwanensis]RUO44215.1 damage-inducible protein CinA [Aliidiomarina taiwanensis]